MERKLKYNIGQAFFPALSSYIDIILKYIHLSFGNRITATPLVLDGGSLELMRKKTAPYFYDAVLLPLSHSLA